MNKIFKVIWNEARNAYVVVSEIAKNHGSKSCSTKKLLAMLIATGVMTCASFDVLAAKPAAEKTADQQYVALKAKEFDQRPSIISPDRAEWEAQQKGEKKIGGYTYRYDETNKYWVREGYVLTVDKNGGKYTPLSENAIRADVKYAGTSKPEGILQSVTSRVSETDIVTNSGYRLNEVIAGAFAGVSNGGGTEIPGGWNYIIKDSSWNVSGVEFQEGYADLKSDKLINPSPKGFVTVNSNGKLQWDSDQQVYTYNGEMVNYSNMYVIDGKLGVFTNYGGDKVYTGKVYGKHNEILMTVKDGDKFYSYWGAKVTDPSATMATFPVSEYQENLNVIKKNEEGLLANDIKEVTLDTSKANSATIGLLRNGGNAVDGAITVTSGGGTGGSDAAHDTFVKISNGTTEQTFATGSKVEAIGSKDATTGIKINGEAYTIKSGSKVSVTKTADKKTTTITVDGQATTITDTDTHNALESASLSGKTLTITGKDGDKASVDLSPIDTDTTYTAGNGIAIDKTNKNAISVKLKEGENNLEVTEAGLALKKALTVNSVKAGDTIVNTNGLAIGTGDRGIVLSTNNVSMGGQQIHNVAKGTNDNDAVNVSQLNETNTKVENLKVEAGKHTTLVNGENTTVEPVGDGTYGKQYKVNVDLSQYAKTEDVAVVYVDNNKNKSLHTTNSGAVESNAIALGKGASAHENSVVIGDGAYTQGGNLWTGSGYSVALGNNAVTGTKSTSVGYKAIGGRVGTITVGYNSYNGAAYGTVIGTESKINYSDKKTANAAATIVGAQSEIIADNKPYSGVANGIFGSANKIQNSNGVTIQGSGNTVTDAYKDMSGSGFNLGGVSVKKDAGAVGVIGGMNTVSNQIYTNVIGFGNTVAGDADNISHDVFLAGSRNNLSNVSDSIVMGNENAITGVSNVISFGHQNTISANNAVAIGNGAGVSVEGGVALGVGSVASTAANALGYGAAEGETGIAWKATNGAVSVGSSVEGKKITRQITNVAAGTEDTDAVNVAQLKKVSEADASASQGWKLKTKNGNASDVKPGATVEFDGDDNIVVSNTGNNVVVKLGKELTGLTSVTTNNAYVTKVDASKNESVTNVEYVKNQIADAALSAGKGISITDKKINVKLKDGEENLKVDETGLYLRKDLTGMESITGVGGGKISFSGGNVTINKITFNNDGRIQNVANGTENTDAVNFGQLQAVKNELIASDKDTHIDTSKEYNVGANNQIKLDVLDKDGKKLDQQVVINDVAKASDVGDVSKIADDLKNGGNKPTTVVDAVNNLNQKLDNKVGDLNYVEGGKGNYVTNGENTTTSIGKLDQALKDVADTANQGWNLSTNGGEASKVAPGKTVDFSGDKNIIISNDGTNVKVKLNEAITAKTVTTGNTVMNSDGVKVGADVSLNKNGLNVGKDVSVTATAVTAGKTSISDEGVKVGDKTYINDKGLNANGQNITNVADGKVEKDSKDAINGGQLHQAKADINNRIDGVENQVVNNTNRINKLGSRVNKVGAGAAALAALHPMDFDPDDKLTFSAGYGNYGGENAAAIGAYYRPDEKVMFSVAGTVGNGENMVNAGVSFALDRTNHVSNSRTALAREVIDLRGQLAVMGAKMAKMEKALGMLDETKTKLFPDIPANHWAYEYIAKLAGNGYIEGYPDGNFGGDRLMTRYEFAAMLYRAIENGAALEEKIIKEFEPELGRIRVDRISGEDGDRDKIERVRVNDTKGERDHYGNKLAK